MNSYGKKAVSILLLLVMLCTITAMAAAEGESNSNTESGVVVVLTPDGMTEGSTSGTETNTPSSDAGTANQPAGSEQGASSGPGTSGTEKTTESDASVTTSEMGPGGASTTETAAGPTATEPATAGPTAAEPTPTPSPSPSAAPQPASTGLPTVTKHPTDETVDIGGECVFIANYSNAIWAVWHFVSPDGKTDYRFDDKAMQTAFPGLKVENGMYSNMSLKNIPAELNGWRVCCEYRPPWPRHRRNRPPHPHRNRPQRPHRSRRRRQRRHRRQAQIRPRALKRPGKRLRKARKSDPAVMSS